MTAILISNDNLTMTIENDVLFVECAAHETDTQSGMRSFVLQEGLGSLNLSYEDSVLVQELYGKYVEDQEQHAFAGVLHVRSLMGL
jgi:hypothetical protein